jgi:methionyl-tRNA formyltransferase
VDRPSPRIVVCHLESLVCLPALNQLFADLGAHIELVVLSERFGVNHGNVFQQLVKGTRRSGLRLTLWLGFDIISAKALSSVGRWVSKLTRRPPSLQSAENLAVRYGAKICRVPNVNEPEAIETIRAYHPDFVIVMNFDQILQPPLIQVPSVGVINIHPSLLPSFRGPCPVYWAMAEQQNQVGVTLHLIEDSEIDAGPIVEQAQLNSQGLSVAEVTAALFCSGVRLLRPALEKLSTGHLCLRPQKAQANGYRSFPTRSDIVQTRKLGMRLCRVGHIAGVLARGVVGLPRRSR